MNAQPSLYSILTRARPTWSNDDLCRVHEKMKKAGITDLGSLSRAISEGSLNNALATLGERKLKSSTLQQLKLVVRQLRQKQDEEPLHPLILRHCYCDKCLVEPSRSSCCEMLNSPSKPVTPQQKPGFNGKLAVLPRLLAGKSKSEAALPKDRTLLPQLSVPAKPRLVPLSSANKEPVSHGPEVPTLRLRPLGSVLKSRADSAQCQEVEDLSRKSSKEEAPNSSATLSCASWVGDFPAEKPLPAKVALVPPREPILSSFGQQAQDWKFGPRLLPALEKERLRMASEAVILVKYVGATMKRDPLVPEGFQVKARQEGGPGALRADDLPISDAARARLHRARMIHAYS